MRWVAAAPALVIAALLPVAAGADTVLTRGPGILVQGSTVTQAGATWTNGDGYATESYLSRPNSQKKTMVRFSWKLPSSVPPAGSKGSITVSAIGGDLDGIAPGLSLNGPLVGCTGISNTASYGSGCADGDHASVGVNVQPNQSATATQDFLIKGGAPGEVTITFSGPRNVVYKYTASSSSSSSGTAIRGGSTAKAALGTPVTLPAPAANKPANISSPPIPASAKKLELVADFTDADVEKAAIAIKLLLDAHNRRAELDKLAYYCEFIRPFGGMPKESSLTKPVAGLTNCVDVEQRYADAEGKVLNAQGCPVEIVPVWSAGATPTAAQESASIALAKKQFMTSCPTHDQIRRASEQLVAIFFASQDIRASVGTSAQVSVVRPSSATDGSDPRLTVTWKQP